MTSPARGFRGAPDVPVELDAPTAPGTYHRCPFLPTARRFQAPESGHPHRRWPPVRRGRLCRQLAGSVGRSPDRWRHAADRSQDQCPTSSRHRCGPAAYVSARPRPRWRRPCHHGRRPTSASILRGMRAVAFGRTRAAQTLRSDQARQAVPAPAIPAWHTPPIRTDLWASSGNLRRERRPQPAHDRLYAMPSKNTHGMRAQTIAGGADATIGVIRPAIRAAATAASPPACWSSRAATWQCTAWPPMTVAGGSICRQACSASGQRG